MRTAARLPAAALAFAATLLPLSAAAEQLVLSVSTSIVKITSNFTGTGLTVFGAIERDAATVSRGSTYDIVVVMRGPNESLVTRRKERFAGVWINRDSRSFADVPSFYSVNASRPIDQVSTPQVLKRYQIGAENLAFNDGDGGDDAPFREALIRLKREAGLFRDEPYGVTFPGASVFQTNLTVPANVPIGVYRVSAYLFRDDVLLASSTAAVQITKAGFEQFTFDLARNRGFVYGVITVLLAMLTGWLAGVIFRRD